MRWSSSACCTARATSPRSPSAEDSPNDAPDGQRGQASLGSLPRPYLPLCLSGAERAGVRWGDCRAPVTDDNPSGRLNRYAEGTGAGGHTSVKSDECCIQSPRDRDVDRIRSAKVDIETPQNPICCVDIGGRDLLPVCGSRDPCIEIRECKLPVFPCEVALRTRRPTADENSAPPKSLTTTISGCADKKASARALDGSITNSATRTLASK
jgi:hypothetical protein